MPSTAQPRNTFSEKIESWFDALGWEVFAFQRQAWSAYAKGKSGLIHAPTGVGKTYAAFGGPAAEALQRPVSSGLQVLWITPLRALANDTADALRRMIEALELDWQVDIRHGDVSSTTKARLRKQLPQVLVTTPESLCLLLSYAEAPQLFAKLRCVVCDEWHELLGSKRGVQAELALSRLRTLAPELRIWGLSATIGNLPEALATLLGKASAEGVIVSGNIRKEVSIETLLPDTIENFPWAGHLGIRLLPAVVERIKAARTTLVFTNTRSQTEMWHQGLLKAAPELADVLAVHHGSVDRELRKSVEAGLDDGSLRAVVCTSSLDLGVDFSPVEQVIQIGSPKGIARLMQRAGRSGHRPGVPSRILGVPTNALEILEFAAAREAMQRGEIESRKPRLNCIDVLLQHLISTALSRCAHEAEIKEEVFSTAAFAGLDEQDWAWVMGFAKGTVGALTAYPEYQKIAEDEDGQLIVPSKSIARFHRMSIGTITSDSEVTVKFQRGTTLGHIEEGYISRLKPGDVFHFAGRRVALVRFRHMTAYVKSAGKRAVSTPTWAGGRAPLSSELAHAVARLLNKDSVSQSTPEIESLRPLLLIQQERSQLPGDAELLVEYGQFRRAWSVFIYPFAGRLVHEGLAALAAYRLSRGTPLTLKTTVNDYGFSLQSAKPFAVDDEAVRAWMSPERLTEDLLECLNTTELARRHFREIARVAGLTFQGFPGQQKSVRSLQMSSGLLFDVFEKYDTDNRLLQQARRELLDRQLEHTRLLTTLQSCALRPLRLIETPRPTPFAFPLWAEALHDQISSESWSDRVAAFSAELEDAP